MTLRDFIDSSQEHIENKGLLAVPTIAAEMMWRSTRKVPGLSRLGTTITEADWDIALVLDACRWDMYHDIVGSGRPVWCASSSSPEFIQRLNERKDQLQDVRYVTGNPFSSDLNPDTFSDVEEVWQRHWDDDEGTVPPRPITDRVISSARDGDRILAHYMQPHHPFVGSDIDDAMGGDIVGEPNHRGFWDRCRFDGPPDGYREAYWNNLRFVWEEVKLVLENVDGTVLVTADHGNAMGEWGIWGHNAGIQHPRVRRVPWDIHDCTDQETYVPDLEAGTNDLDRQEQLESLGYL